MRLGIAHHLGWAVAVTASAGHQVADRRRIELIEPGMPTAPIHHEVKPLDDAAVTALVAQVRASAVRAATASLDELVARRSPPARHPRGGPTPELRRGGSATTARLDRSRSTGSDRAICRRSAARSGRCRHRRYRSSSAGRCGVSLTSVHDSWTESTGSPYPTGRWARATDGSLMADDSRTNEENAAVGCVAAHIRRCARDGVRTRPPVGRRLRRAGPARRAGTGSTCG